MLNKTANEIKKMSSDEDVDIEYPKLNKRNRQKKNRERCLLLTIVTRKS